MCRLGFSGDSQRPPLTEQVNEHGLIWVSESPVPGATTQQWPSGFLLPQMHSYHPGIPNGSREHEGRTTGHFTHRSLNPRTCSEAAVGLCPHSDRIRHEVPYPNALLEDTMGTGVLWEEDKLRWAKIAPNSLSLHPSIDGGYSLTYNLTWLRILEKFGMCNFNAGLEYGWAQGMLGQWNYSALLCTL